ncbi:MAG: hypothetical protein M3P23_15980 [Actinomycetota bacterium]|nr:hypothetical protein [Actinomycetota bacterium]
MDYVDTFIDVADNSTATNGTVLHGKPSVAAGTFPVVAEHPYRFTSDPFGGPMTLEGDRPSRLEGANNVLNCRCRGGGVTDPA